jgi:hypothetical protein
MIEEAINRIVELTRQGSKRDQLTQLVAGEFDGNHFDYEHKIEPTNHGPKLGEVLTPFRVPKLVVSTLTGFLDAIAAGVGGKLEGRIIHVEDHETVSLKTAQSDVFGVRDTLLTAKYAPTGAFVFDNYQKSETFLIGLETCFLQIDDDDSFYVKQLASNLKSGDTVHAQDDGVNQSITLKTGQIEAADHKVKARVKLTPIRTFSEAAPVESEFLIRFRPSPDGLPQVALFSLGGTRWKGESMLSIKKYLADNLGDVRIPILA